MISFNTGFLIANAILFQVGWFICILYGEPWAALVTGLGLVVHFRYSACRSADFLALVLALLIGFIHDSILIGLGYIDFVETAVLPPSWLICLWALFGITLNHSLLWVYKRFWLAAALGIIAGPLSYVAGVHLSTAEWGAPLRDIVPLLAFMWLLILPLHRYIYLRVSHALLITSPSNT